MKDASDRKARNERTEHHPSIQLLFYDSEGLRYTPRYQPSHQADRLTSWETRFFQFCQ